MGQTKNRSSEKIALKKTNRTNIIAKNFVWEQLKSEVIKNTVIKLSTLQMGFSSSPRFEERKVNSVWRKIEHTDNYKKINRN